MPPVRSGAAAFIFVTILLDMLALGLIMPVLPKLVESFVDNDTATAARIFGLFGTAWALMQFLFSPILGALSDRFGRRPVVLLSNFGLALDYVLMALAPSLIWLFIGRVISGITSASISTAFAYIADVTPPEQRAAVFGKIGAAFGAGFILGPALGGLLGGIDPRLPFWVAAALSFANALYGLLILPESLPPERRSPFRWRSANPLGALHLLRSNRVLAGLSMVQFLGQLAHVVLPSYLRALRDLSLWLGHQDRRPDAGDGRHLRDGGAGRGRSGRSSSVSASAGRCCSGLAAAPRLSDFRCGADRAAVLARHSRDGVVGRGQARPSQALMTRLVAPEQQGQLQGATTSVQQHAQLVGPFLFTLTFAYFIGEQGAVEDAGRAVLAGGGVVGAGAGGCVAHAGQYAGSIART